MLRWYCNDRRFVLYQSRTARMRTGKLDLIRESMSIPYASWGARILNSMFCLLSPPTAPGTRSNLMALNVQFVCSIILWIHHKLYSNVMLMHPFCVCVCVRYNVCIYRHHMEMDRKSAKWNNNNNHNHDWEPHEKAPTVHSTQTQVNEKWKEIEYRRKKKLW